MIIRLVFIRLFRFNTYLNASISADSLFRLATRWFMWRMESLALVTITLTAVVTVATKVGPQSPSPTSIKYQTSFYLRALYLPP